MHRSAADAKAAKEASLLAALLRQHRAVGKFLAGMKAAGPGRWALDGIARGELVDAHEAANAEPLMPRPRQPSAILSTRASR
jgi:hypothetical protein